MLTSFMASSSGAAHWLWKLSCFSTGIGPLAFLPQARPPALHDLSAQQAAELSLALAQGVSHELVDRQCSTLGIHHQHGQLEAIQILAKAEPLPLLLKILSAGLTHPVGNIINVQRRPLAHVFAAK